MTKLLVALLLCLIPLAAAEAVTITATVNWTDNSTDETGFRVERKQGTGGVYASIGTTGAGVVSFVDPGPLSQSTDYCYRIFATNGIGDSLPSNEACATTPGTPAAPGGVQVIITVVP